MDGSAQVLVVASPRTDCLLPALRDVDVRRLSWPELGGLVPDGPTLLFLDSGVPARDVQGLVQRHPGWLPVLFLDGEQDPGELINYIHAGVMEVLPSDRLEGVGDLLERYAARSGEAVLAWRQQVAERFREVGFLTQDGPTLDLLGQVLKAARSQATVLISGENGTGKELVARSLHLFSARKDHRFVAVHTGAIPETLLESELFGHVKGAFTSAVKDRQGRFEHAHRGTVFLDEVGTMPPALQVKLLRVLQERNFERVGDNQTVSVDVRVVAATNQDLMALVKTGAFREDLYYRLNVIPITLPPLRQRRGDIPALANLFLRKAALSNGLPPRSFTLPALRLLGAYHWPGNIRQLENIVERMVVLNPETPVLGPGHVPAEIRPLTEDPPGESSETGIPTTVPREGLDLNGLIRNLEKRLIFSSLEQTDWNKQQAANLLGIKRTTLIEKVRKYQEDGG